MIAFILLAVLVSAVALGAWQSPAHRVIGVVTETTPGGTAVETDAGEVYAIAFLPGTIFRKVPPGERDLTKAQFVQASDLATGDRVLARGTLNGTVLTAQSIIVMSRSDLDQKRQGERAEWQRRGVAGLVTAVNTGAQEVAIRIPSLMGEAQTMTIAVGPQTQVRRYAPDSVRFADAQPSTLGEIKLGDQLRALGDKTQDGTRLAAAEVVTGAFLTVAGTVQVADESGLKIKDLDSGKLLTVKITSDSVLKRFPSTTWTGAPGGPAASGPTGSGPQGRGTAGATGASRAGFPGAAGSPGEMRRPDLSQMLERLPTITLAGIKTGDTIVVASTKGASADTLTAITLLAGAERLIAMRQAAAAGSNRQSTNGTIGGSWNLGDMSMIPMQ
jgi:hypothetical protein